MKNCTLYMLDNRYGCKRTVNNPTLGEFLSTAIVELCSIQRGSDQNQHLHVFLKEDNTIREGVVCFTVTAGESSDEVTKRVDINVSAISACGEINTAKVATDINNYPTIQQTYLRIAKNAFLNLLSVSDSALKDGAWVALLA